MKMYGKCVDNSSWTEELTLGKVYEIEESYNNTRYDFINDRGLYVRRFKYRFEVVEQPAEGEKELSEREKEIVCEGLDMHIQDSLRAMQRALDNNNLGELEMLIADVKEVKVLLDKFA